MLLSQLLGALRSPWYFLACGRIAPVFTSMSTWPFARVFSFCLLQKHSSLHSRSTLRPYARISGSLPGSTCKDPDSKGGHVLRTYPSVAINSIHYTEGA